MMNMAAMLPGSDKATKSESRFSDKAYGILLDRLVRLHYQPLQPLNERERNTPKQVGAWFWRWQGRLRYTSNRQQKSPGSSPGLSIAGYGAGWCFRRKPTSGYPA